jgi:excisionase family DNA binding protein
MTKLLVDKVAAASMLSISLNTLNRKIADGEIPQPVRLGGRVLFRYDQLTAFVESLGGTGEVVPAKKRGRPRLAV